jgi:hypothetical protein
MTRVLEQVLSTPFAAVVPAFDGLCTLPRMADWQAFRARLYREAREVELPASVLMETGLGQAFLRQAEALGVSPKTLTLRAEARHEGLTLELSLRGAERIVEDRWELEIDELGLIREMRSEYRTGEGRYEAGDYSRFFNRILTAVA